MILHRKNTLSKEQAENLAIKVLTFISSDIEKLGRFLSLTGLGPENIRQSAKSPDFLKSVLDYLGTDEPLLIECAQNIGCAPETIIQAREML